MAHGREVEKDEQAGVPFKAKDVTRGDFYKNGGGLKYSSLDTTIIFSSMEVNDGGGSTLVDVIA